MFGNNINNSPLVSVIINCFNGEDYLTDAIDSVIAQTYKNWEIIFWDNCSTDGSAAIAIQYGEKIKYYRSDKNTSLGEARNKAIQVSNGVYIAFIDCDDIWSDHDKLKKQVDIMESNPNLSLTYGSIEEILLDKSHFRNVINKHETGNIFGVLLTQFDISIITSLIRKSCLIESGLNFDPAVTASEEYCLFMQLASKYPISVSKEIMAKYRVHSTSLTSSSLSRLGSERRYTLNLIINKNSKLSNQFRNEFREAFARADYYDARWEMDQRNKSTAFKLLIKNSFISYRYFLLALITLLPIFCWQRIHLLKRSRV